MTNALQMDTLLTAADHAARQSDRWLFIFLLFVILGATGWLVKSLTARLQHMTDLHILQAERMGALVSANTAALNEVAKKLLDLMNFQVTETEEMHVTISRNTAALELAGQHASICKYIQEQSQAGLGIKNKSMNLVTS